MDCAKYAFYKRVRIPTVTLITETVINGKIVKVLPLAHPRQIGALGAHNEKWYQAHRDWENNR